MEFSVRYSRRKTIGLYVLADGNIEVRAPFGTASELITEFVDSKQKWLTTQREKQRREADTSLVLRFSHGSEHYHRGAPFRLYHQPSKHRSQASLDWQDGDCYAALIDAYPAEQQAETLLTEWYRREAKSLFQARLENQFFAMQAEGVFANLGDIALPGCSSAGLPMPSLRVKALRSRWGSCSSRGNINLNLWLVREPDACIDYVIAHELCHLLEMNHSQRFYALLSHWQPDWKKHEHYLNRRAQALPLKF